jgi:hypothetical protein
MEFDEMKPISAPVVTRPERLPLGDPNFIWEQFEAFCRDFICKYLGVEECHHYGKPGDVQNGIDLFVDLPNGERWTFQCRQVEKFTKAQAEKTMRETTYKANRYHFLLSCEASKAVRDAADSIPNWDVWDIRDISGKVRDLDIEVARQLVETHFGSAWRKDFLGLADLSPFLSTEDFFRPLSDSRKLFNHNWQLIGRTGILKQLREFIDSDIGMVAILPGRGGIGKSKVLQELGKTLDGTDGTPASRFLVEGASIENSLDGLPAQECVIIADDSHRRDDLRSLLALIRRRKPKTKLILASRPHAIERLRATVIQSGFDSRELTLAQEIKELDRGEVIELARQSLTPEYLRFAEQLAAATWDCPLITVVGGRLLSEKSLDPRLLERNEEFRDSVLAKFYDEIVGQIGTAIDPADCQAVLRLIATISPFNDAAHPVIESAASFLNIEEIRMIEILGVLEQAGVLLRRGNTLRITPDVLADHILHRACQTPQGKKTGYAEKVFETFASISPSQVLRNLAELDWRVSQSDGNESDLLNKIWEAIDEEFRLANNAGRCRILDLLKEVAYYQPKRMITLVEYAQHNPTAAPEDERFAALYSFSHTNVLHKLPPLLRAISYTLEYMPRCCDLLWHLGRDDDRRLNSNPDHAIRILEDLAGYDIDKPLSINHVVLQAVQRWLKEAGAHDHLHSPLHMLDPLLAKSGHSDHGDGGRIVLTPFQINRENTERIRREALNVISACARSSNLRIALRGIRSLGTALQEPIPYMAMTISAEDKARWAPDQIDVLGRLREAADASDHPLIHLKVIGQARWTARRGSPENVKQTAQALIDSIPKSFELDITKFLIDSYDKERMFDGDGTDWQEKEREKLEVRSVAAAEFFERYSDPADGLQFLTGRFRDIIAAGVELQPWLFFHALSILDPEYAARICEEIFRASDCPLEPFFGNLLHNVRQADRDRSFKLMTAVLGSDRLVLLRGIATSYESWARLGDLDDRECQLLESLLATSDEITKYHAIKSLAGVGRLRTRWAIDRAVTVDIGNSVALAEAVAEIFDNSWGIPPESLNNSDIEALLAKFETVDQVEGFEISQFLSYAAKRMPQAVIRLILARIDRDAANHNREYQPLPYNGFHEDLSGVSESSEYEEILREVRNRALGESWSLHFWLPKLFLQISAAFGPVCLRVLKEWVDSGEEEKVEAVGALVGDAYANFVFAEVQFVEDLLNRALGISEECYSTVCGYLRNSANSEVRTSALGQPAPQDISVRDQAREVATKLTASSPAQRFYQGLASQADAAIREGLARDEEFLG